MEYRQLDESERLAKLALDLRYALNAKTVKASKIFDRAKSERNIKRHYHVSKAKPKSNSEISEAITRLNNHFMRKGE